MVLTPRLGRTALLTLALAAVVSPASGFCRTTTRATPADYNPTEQGCFIEGLFVFWRNACTSYSVQRAATERVPFPEVERIVDASFAAWMATRCAATKEAPGVRIANLGPVDCGEVRYNPGTANQNLIVLRDTNWPYQNADSTLGLTTLSFTAVTGEIVDADIEINASGGNLSISDEPSESQYDLASIVTHEAGHFFGLAHSSDRDATMFAAYELGATGLRSLAPDDTAGICAIYPNDDVRVVSTQPAPTCTWCGPSKPGKTERIAAGVCDSTPRGGLTTACTAPMPRPVPVPNCAAGPHVRTSATSALTSALVGAGFLVVRRRGVRARRLEGTPRSHRA